MIRFLATIVLLGCSEIQVPVTPRCGAVDVASGIVATANHCPTYGVSVYRDEGADLQLVQVDRKTEPVELQLSPIEHGEDATLRGHDFIVMDPLILSDGRFFLRAWPELEPGDSGFGLWRQGKLLGIAIGNDGEYSAFVHAAEVKRALDRR
jgi:hypothetical protein